MDILVNHFYRTRTGAILQVIAQKDLGDSFYADFCFQTDLGSTLYRIDGRVFRDRFDPMDLVAEVTDQVSDAPVLGLESQLGCFVKYKGQFIDYRQSENRVPGVNWFTVEEAILVGGLFPDEVDLHVWRLLSGPSAEMLNDLESSIDAVGKEIRALIDANPSEEEFEPLYQKLVAKRKDLREQHRFFRHIRI